MPESVASKIEQYFSQYPKRSYPKGQILIFGDENPEYIFYLIKGRIIKYDVSYRGDDVVINTFKPGAFVPMSWIATQLPNHYFFRTDEASELYLAPVAETTAFIKNNPDVMFDLLTRIYYGLDGLSDRLVQLMSGSAKSRLLTELRIEAQRFGIDREDGGRQLVASEQDIAARAGLSRETVSREIRKLKESGLVRMEKNSIIIPDVTALEQAVRKPRG